MMECGGAGVNQVGIGGFFFLSASRCGAAARKKISAKMTLVCAEGFLG